MMPRPVRPVIQRVSRQPIVKVTQSFPLMRDKAPPKRPNGKIIILWATVRPELFKVVHSYWMANALFPNNIITRVAVDTEIDSERLKGYDVLVTGNKRPGVCFPCYCLSKTTVAEDKDIIVFASDDFYPPKNWDSFLADKMNDETEKVLVVNDGLQKFPSEVVTLPIMHFGALKKMNYVIYHPAYSHMHSDVELYKTANKMGLLKDIREIDQTVFSHKHHSSGARKKDRADYLLENSYKEGKELKIQRDQLDIKELLRVDENIDRMVLDVLSKKEDSNAKLLSILICTIPKRKLLLNRLLWILKKQETKQTEIITLSDDNGMTIGNKRNRLLDMAKGKYICFIDDDDTVSDDYIRKILKAIEKEPDCCSLEGLYTIDGKDSTIFRHSLDYKEWKSVIENGHKIYQRCPNHLNVVKRELALKIRFDNNLSIGEDKDYSERLLPFLKSEQKIEGIIYHYLFLTRRV